MTSSSTHKVSAGQDGDESAQWVKHALKQLTLLAISAGVVGASALGSDGVLTDERMIRDLNWMSSGLKGELLYYIPRLEPLPPPVPTHGRPSSHANGNTPSPRANCKVYWLRHDPRQSYRTDTVIVMGEYALLRAGESPVVKDEDEAEDLALGKWDLPRRKSRGAGEGGKKPVLN